MVILALGGGTAYALPDDSLYVPADGTFRDTVSLSRFERAALLAQRLSAASDLWSEFGRNESQALQPELQALGVDVRGVAERGQAASTFKRWSGLKPDVWSLNRMTAVDAFWTDPSSPVLTFATSVESSEGPRVAPPAPDRFNMLAEWKPPPPKDDFTVSSPDGVLPANERIALNPRLAMDFAFSPHLQEDRTPLPRVVVDDVSHSPLLPSNVTTLESLARLGLPGGTHPDVPVIAPSPLLRGPSMSSGPLRLPQVALADAAIESPLLSDARPSVPGWRLGGGFQSAGVLGTIPARTDSLFEPDFSTHSFLASGDLLGAGSAWSHYSVGAGYPIAGERLDFNVRFDEWTFGQPTALGGLAASGRTFGLDRLRLQDARLNLDFNIDPRLSLHGGYIYSHTSGLYGTGMDPAISNISVAGNTGYPYLGFDYKVSKNTRWNVNIRFYNTPLDFNNAPSGPRNPLNVADPQVTTEVKVRF